MASLTVHTMQSNSVILSPGTDASSLHCVGGKSSVSGVNYFMQQEVWKDVIGYETLYAISSIGRLLSHEKQWISRKTIIRKPKMFIKLLLDHKGYPRVGLWKNGKCKIIAVHRMVADAFIPNPQAKPFINHINGIKYDNRIENLEWCNQSENMLHAYKIGLQKPLCGVDNPRSKKVAQFTLDGVLIKIWGSTREAKRVGGFHNSSIRFCCIGKYNSHKGFKWKYLN